MLVSIALTAAAVCTVRACTKMSRRDAMARDLRRDLLGRDRDILFRDQDETRHASVRDREETETLRILSETRPRRDVSTSRDRDVSTETTFLMYCG